MAAAEAKGFDFEGSRQELLELAQQDTDAVLDSGITAEEYLNKYPVLKQWLDFRCDSVNNLYSQISRTSKALQAGIDIRWNNYVRTQGYYSGIDLPSFINHIDSIRANAFVEHEDDPDLVDEKIEHLNHFNEIVQDRVHWVAALDIRGRNPAVLERSAELSSYTGCDGYALSHYGGATLENLRAVKRGLKKSKWAEHF
jgi:hypothetical protein